MKRDDVPRLAWALTGSGHYLKESLEIALSLPNVDLYLSKAAVEVLHMYTHSVSDLRSRIRIFRDNTARLFNLPAGNQSWRMEAATVPA